MSREEFEKKIIDTWGDEALAATKDTIEPCSCGGPFCNGWKLDVNALIDASRKQAVRERRSDEP